MQRILGVDVGLKRVGIAQSDLTGILASPLGTFSYDDAMVHIHHCPAVYPRLRRPPEKTPQKGVD